MYKKVIIESDKDLPKDGHYFCYLKSANSIHLMNGNRGFHHLWREDVEWYLQPFTPQLREVTDEEIESHFRTEHYDNKNGHHYRINKDRIFGAKWMREQMKASKETLSQRRTAEGVMPSAETIFTNAWNLGQKQFINWIDPYLKELEKSTEKPTSILIEKNFVSKPGIAGVEGINEPKQ